MRRSLRVAMLAGEASGDMLGAAVIDALRARCDDLVVEGIGGSLMQERGLESLFPMDELAVMGLVEPLKRLPRLLRIRRAMYRHFRDNPPDLFLGIDSPDFNLPLERKLRQARVKTAHLVSPSVWAWRQGRIRGIGRSVDLMLCLFPFETAIYEQHGIEVRFVGHPLADEIPLHSESLAAREQLGLARSGKLLALLPGSRASEVRALAPLFLQVAQRLSLQWPTLGFVLPAANAARMRELRDYLSACPGLPVTLLQGQSREAMAAADAVLLASGTAALEAALLRRPMVVAYRMGGISWWLLSRLVRTPYVALPNLLADKALVPELLQADATPDALAAALQPMLSPGQAAVPAEFGTIHRQLRRGCAARVADELLQLAG